MHYDAQWCRASVDVICRDLDDEDAIQVNNFFQVVLGFVHKLIPHDFVEILETLNRLFTTTRCTYYMKYGKDDPNEVSELC